ncbi:SIS domain-containing protein [Acidisphaera sp. L21]|jgi:arabinose-5-phosphate isomerase|uniref:KpsF/GutQ family sugar-phosphate isomerase n=1 Tax=Acidisphaera sp. L21 TaxID=1641851 RepID=UPI00131BE40A|nr:KpsF/GutQ family sugar-phosphate isomerase [Acidisphaera sp. L21]
MSAVVASSTDLDVARSVLGTEAAGLRALAASLDGSFDRAVLLLSDCTGRIAVSGMGKSGHVARKTAATLASTGSPAFFVHPAEASHGDLGMVQPADALLLFSNSGETTELADLVAHAHRFRLPLIAITGRAQSTLAQAADVVLLLPAAPEACAVTSAPTTSTTMQMALGDALAVVLLTRRGFTATDFRAFHPGGRLGAQLRRVGELMHEGDAVPLAEPGTPMQQALLLMTGKGFGCVGVVEHGVLVGIVTDGDLRRAMGPDLLDQPVRAVMTAKPRTIRADALAADALWLMNEGERRITSLFVVDAAGAPLGVLHVHDLLRAGVA